MTVFRQGDIVYTRRGKGLVVLDGTDGRAPGVDHAMDGATNVLTHYTEDEVSFSPWPEPDHKRPLVRGWYAVSYQGTYCLMHYELRGSDPYWSLVNGSAAGYPVYPKSFIVAGDFESLVEMPNL